jgi:hypothetical protein
VQDRAEEIARERVLGVRCAVGECFCACGTPLDGGCLGETCCGVTLVSPT